jgi:predicted acyl esterase
VNASFAVAFGGAGDGRPRCAHEEDHPDLDREVYEVDVEVWPTCIVLPQGYRLALSVRGTDYVFPGEPAAGLETLGKVWTGVGPFTHNDPRDRPPAIFGGDVTLHAGPHRQAHVLLPVIP